MDFGFTAEQETLRKEVHDYLLNELPEDYQGDIRSIGEELQSFAKGLQSKFAQKGWLTAGWPKEYGGMGYGHIEQGILNEEEGYHDIYWPALVGVHLAGPALLLFGTEEQKKRFLPAITRGEVIYLEGFTEPNAGSDEANVQLRAVQKGNDFVLNGQKMFISSTYKPNYVFTLARTANTTPKHKGLSIFLIPADTPGLSYRPLSIMGYGVMTNEVFFDDVKVSREYLLGELNKGFYHAMVTLEYERSGIQWMAGARRLVEEFVQFCKETKRGDKKLWDNEQVRDALAKIVVEMEVWRLANWRTIWRQSQRERLGQLDYDLSSFYWKTLPGSHTDAMMDILNLYGQLETGSKWAKLAGAVERQWLRTRSRHEGGTPEIVKIVLGERTLGLPRRR